MNIRKTISITLSVLTATSVLFLSGCGNPEKKIDRTNIMKTSAFNASGDIIISYGKKGTDNYFADGYNISLDIDNNTEDSLITKGTIMKNDNNELVPYMDFTSDKSVLYFSSHDVPESLFTEKQLKYLESAAQNYVQVDLLHTQNHIFNPGEETANIAAAAKYIFTNFTILKNNKAITASYDTETNSETFVLSKKAMSKSLDDLSRAILSFSENHKSTTAENNTDTKGNTNTGPEEFFPVWNKLAKYWIENSTTYTEEDVPTRTVDEVELKDFNISISFVYREKDINVIIDGTITTDIVRNINANLILSSIKPFEISLPERFTTHKDFISAMEMCSIPDNLQVPASNPSSKEEILEMLEKMKGNKKTDKGNNDSEEVTTEVVVGNY